MGVSPPARHPVGPPAAAPATRRRALAGAAALAAALTLEACGAHRNRVKSSLPVALTDVAVLHGLLELEYKTQAAYEAGIPLLGTASAKVARQFLPQEEAHAGELAGLIKKAGIEPPKPSPRYDLGHPRTSGDVLRLLHRLEAQQVSAYLSAIPLLSEGPVRAALAAVMANDAQHLAVLRTQLHRAPAPAAFVNGRE